MNFLYLPGFSSKNINELESFENFFRAKNLTLITHKWNHWAQPDEDFDINYEVNLILEKVSLQDQITLIAKSYGTFVGGKLVTKMNFEKVILMGLPFVDLNDVERGSYNNYKNDITVFQRINDFHGSIEQAKSMINPKEAKFIELEGETHQYDIPELVYNEIENGI